MRTIRSGVRAGKRPSLARRVSRSVTSGVFGMILLAGTLVAAHWYPWSDTNRVLRVGYLRHGESQNFYIRTSLQGKAKSFIQTAKRKQDQLYFLSSQPRKTKDPSEQQATKDLTMNEAEISVVENAMTYLNINPSTGM